MKWEIGIDEAGRGPLAGPVAVGVVKIPKDFDWDLVPGVHDSKQISEKNRELIYKKAVALRKSGALDFAVSQVSASVIDKIGISRAIKLAIDRSLKKLHCDPKDTYIKLDGSLKAPADFRQETIIKGDSKEKSIGLASICAKVTRDRYMVKQATKYPEYGFDQHMGYGTKVHRAMISNHGTSPIHRVSYCKNCL